MTQEELFESYFVESSNDYEDDGKRCKAYCNDCGDCDDCIECGPHCDWDCDYGCGCDDY